MNMYTIDDIINIRIAVNDPDVIDIIQLATSTELPATPQPQTAYRLTDSGLYMITDLETGATPSDYYPAELEISDATIGAMIDAYGDNAKCAVLDRIATRIGRKLNIIRTSGGAESVEYATALDMYKYYKSLSDDCKEQTASDAGTNVGRIGQMKQPEIAGGNI